MKFFHIFYSWEPKINIKNGNSKHLTLTSQTNKGINIHHTYRHKYKHTDTNTYIQTHTATDTQQFLNLTFLFSSSMSQNVSKLAECVCFPWVMQAERSGHSQREVSLKNSGTHLKFHNSAFNVGDLVTAELFQIWLLLTSIIAEGLMVRYIYIIGWMLFNCVQ